MLIERHYAEIGALVDLTREHMTFERAVLDNVIEARERAIDAQSPRTAALADLRVREVVTELIAFRGVPRAPNRRGVREPPGDRLARRTTDREPVDVVT